MKIHEKTGEIINSIVEQLINKENIPQSGKIIEMLIKKGHSLNDINDAFELISILPEIITPGEAFKMQARQEKVKRALTQIEKHKLSMEAQGFLLRAINSSLITDDEIEEILSEVVEATVPEISVSDLKWIISNNVNDGGRLLLLNASFEDNRESKNRDRYN